MGFFDIFKKKNKKIKNEANEDKPKIYKGELVEGARPCDYLICSVMGKETKLSLFSSEKDDLEEFDDEEIEEINWLVSSNILDSKEVQGEILKAINEEYNSFENNFVERTSLKNEIEISSISVDISTRGVGDNAKKVKIVAFCGSAKCDEEHGISISFKNRKFASIQDEVDFNVL